MASLILFLIIFSVIVISHEFGHFILAKANGIKVNEFFVGMGPDLFHFTKNGTKYSFKLLPLGGACVFEGMDSPDTDAEGSFLKASVWARFATVVAGPVFNFILGFIIAFIMVNMIAVRDPIATNVLEGSPAEAAGLIDGDRILSLNETKICLYEDISLFNVLFKGGDIKVTYERDGKTYDTILTPAFDPEYGRYMLGISNADYVELKGLDYFKYTWYEVRYNFKMTWGSLKMLFTGRASADAVTGPVGIAVNVVGETYESTKEYGWQTVLVNMLNISLMLSINLGVMNLLPIPALDGGRLLFVIIEILRGKPVPPEKEAMVHTAGIVFFLILFVFVFFNDIKNIIF